MPDYYRPGLEVRMNMHRRAFPSALRSMAVLGRSLETWGTHGIAQGLGPRGSAVHWRTGEKRQTARLAPCRTQDVREGLRARASEAGSSRGVCVARAPHGRSAQLRRPSREIWGIPLGNKGSGWVEPPDLQILTLWTVCSWKKNRFPYHDALCHDLAMADFLVGSIRYVGEVDTLNQNMWLGAWPHKRGASVEKSAIGRDAQAARGERHIDLPLGLSLGRARFSAWDDNLGLMGPSPEG